MTREPGLDDRTIDWLREGPERAPDWVLTGADAYARSHPHRRFGVWSSGRSLMSHLHLVRPEEDAGERRVSRAWAGLAVVSLTGVLVAVAFGAGANWGRNGTPAGVIGVPSAPAGSGAPAIGPVTSQVTLAATCRVGTGHIDTESSGVTRSRGGRLLCETSSADPRLAGTMAIFWSSDRRADGTGETWGETTLRAGDGRWSGPFSGSMDPDGAWHLVGALFGADAYAGQRIVFTQVGSPEAFALQGRVEQVEAPADAGDVVVRRLTCLNSGASGTESMDPAGVNHVRGRSMTCEAEASDPRLSGELTLVAHIDEQPDQSARIGGSESLANAGGAWIGTWDGTYDAGWTTHRWTGLVTGSGDYDGLEYRATTIGEWPRFVQVGEIQGGS